MKNMYKNKKADITLPVETIVRLIGAFLLLVIAGWFGAKAYAYFTVNKDAKTFELFVDKINKMNLPQETFTLPLKEKSAIIGFSKNSERYECINCYVGVQNRPTIIFDKPKNEACNDNACICLCNGGFEFLEKNLEGKSTKFGKCSTKLNCKTIQGDIIDKLIIKIYSGINIKVTKIGGGEEYWKNGFLFVNGVAGVNGLKLYEEEIIPLVVEKRSNKIGICNYDMIEYNKNELKFNGCIATS